MKKHNLAKKIPQTKKVEVQKRKTFFENYNIFSYKLQLFLNKHSYILFGVAFLYTFLLSTILQKYHVNDNIAILDDIKGGFAVSFMAFSLGKFFTFLYFHLSSSVEWYGWFLYLSTAISFSLVLYALNKAENLRLFFIPLAISFLSLAIYFVLEIGYNSVSFLAGGSALFAFFVYVFHSQKISYFKIVLIGIVFSLSFLVRMQAVFGVVAFGFPMFGLILILHFKKLWKPLLAFSLPFVLFVSFNYFYESANLSQQDKDFIKFNAVRGQFHDFNIARVNFNNQKLLEVNKWNPEDYQMLLSWIFVDENKYNQQTIQNIFDYSLPLPTNSEMIKSINFDVVWEYYTKIYAKFVYFILIILLLNFFYHKPLHTIWVILYIVFIFAFILYMLVFQRFPERIGNPILFISALFTLLPIAIPLFSETAKTQLKGIKNLLASAFLIILSVYLYKQVTVYDEYIELEKQIQADFDASYEHLQKNYENKFILIQPESVKVRNQSPLKSYDNKFKTISLGWTTFSPRFYSALKQFGIEKGSELFPYMIDNKDAYLLVSEGLLHVVLRFVRDTYKVHCKVIKVEKIEENIFVYQLKKEELTPPTPNHFRTLTWDEYLQDLKYLEEANKSTINEKNAGRN